MFDTPQIRQWLVDLGVTTPILDGPDVPEFPDYCVIITSVGGGLLSYEGLFDQPMFQVRTRGRQGDQDSARSLALEVDEMLVFADLPYEIDDHSVISVNRTGGRPAPLPRNDEGSEDAGRYTYTCTYMIQVSTLKGTS